MKTTGVNLPLSAILFICLLSAGPITSGRTAPSQTNPDTDEVEPITPPAKAMERLPNGNIKLGKVTLRRDSKTLAFPAEMNMQEGLLEVLISTPRGRLHESLLKTEIKAFHLQTMLYLLGLHNGPRIPDEQGKQGSLVNLDIQWEENGETKTKPIEEFVLNKKKERTMERPGWTFVGSNVKDGRFMADVVGNITLLYSIGDTVLDTPSEFAMDDTVYFAHPKVKKPDVGTKVKVIVTPRKQEGDDE